MCSSNTFYNVQSNGDVNQIVNGGGITPIGGWSGLKGDANGLAIGANGSVMYGIDRVGNSSQNISGVLKYDPSTGVFSKISNTSYTTGNSGALIAGAVNLANGRYLFGGTDAGNNSLLFKIYSFDPGTSSISMLGYVDTGLPNDAGSNGDMAFDAAGNLYIVLSGNTVSIFTITAATLAAGGKLAHSATEPMSPGLQDVNGMAFDANGYVYLGNGSTAKKYDPTTWASQGTVTNGLKNSTDLASCNSPANLTVKKNVAGRVAATDQFKMSVTKGQTTVATATTTGTANGIQAKQIGPIPVIAGQSYTIKEEMASGTASQYASLWSCDNGQSGSGTSGTVNIPSKSGAAVVCTFTNSPLITPVKITKIVQDAAGQNPKAGVDWTVGAQLSGTTNGTATATPISVTQQTGADGSASWSIAYTTLDTKTDVTVSETQQSGFDFVSGVCTLTRLNGDTLTVNLPGATGATVPSVAPGDAVDCTITNKVLASKLTLTKVVDNTNGGTAAPTDWTLTATPPSGKALSGTTGSPAVTAAVVTPNVAYTLGETGGPAGYTASAWTCDGGTLSGGKITVAQGGNVTCTITNTAKPATLTLKKVVDNTNGGTAAPADWTLTAAGPTQVSGPGNSPSVTSQSVKAGTYTLSESNGPAGYTGSTWSCTGATLTGSSLVLASGASATCTITNTAQKPTLTLQKQVVNAAGGISPATDWTLKATDGTNTPINGKGTIVSTDVAAISASVLGNTTYTLSESGPSGYTAATTWVCFDSNTQAPLTVTNNNQVKTTVGQNVTCRIVNTAVPGTASVVKNVASLSQNADGTWQIRYTIVVTNTSAASTTTYDLADALKFGTGITVAPGDATWTGPNGTSGTFLADGTATLATGVQLTKAVGTHTYTVNVKASIDAGTNLTSAWKCDSGEQPNNGGFLNSAVMTIGGKPTTVTACAEPSFPVITKVAGMPTQTGASWNVTYTIAVKNPGAVAVQTKLTDAFPATPAGWTLTGGVWNVAAQGGAPIDNTTSAASPIWSGSLPANTTYTYIVSGTLTPAAGATPIGDCATQGKGLTNKATATSGAIVQDATACATITSPAVTVHKSDGTVSQLAGGMWQVDYAISVNNTGGQSTVFTLTDTPNLGTGFTLVSGTWVGGAPIADTPIGPFGTANYTYRVLATFNPQTPNPQLTCDPVKGGAFFNGASIVFPGGTASDTGCGAPAKPVVTKTAQTSTQNLTTGEWTLTYKVAVSNTSTLSLAYTLSDTAAALPTGVTGGAWAASDPTAVGGGTFVRNGSWSGSGELATGTLPAGAVHTYTVTRTVSVASTVTNDALTCGQTPDKGIWNTASVTNGIAVQNSSACATVTRPDVAIAKTVTGTKQLADGSWQITYNVVVTNQSTTAAATYSLSDSLQFGGGITVTSATWTGATSGTFTGTTGTLATNRVLAPKAGAAGVDTYTVTAHATIPASAWTAHPSTLLCQDNATAGGFLNTATVSANGASHTAEDCSSPELPTAKKAPVSSVQNPSNPDNWTVTYTVTVTGGKYDSFYSLSDTPAFASGITLGAGTAQLTGGAVLPITSGTDFAVNQPIAAGATVVYTVTWQATLTNGYNPDTANCTGEPGSGFFNKATLTSGSLPVDQTACIPVAARVYPSITKVVTSTTQKPENGDWVVMYDVTVTQPAKGDSNPQGLSAKYTVTDTPQYGTGINIGNASWTGETTGDFTGATATLATDHVIAAGATQTYHVRILAAVTKSAIDGGTTTCKSGTAPGAGGFLNTALLTSAGQEIPANACSQPVFPTITKTPVGSAVFDPEHGLWRVTYDITVTYPTTAQNPKPVAGYVLTDAPTLPTGVELSGDWTASAANADTPTPTTGTWNGSGTWTILNGGVLDPATTGVTQHTFTVTAQVRVTAAPTEPTICNDVTGIAIWNNAALASGDWTPSADACQVVHYDDVSLTKTTSGVDGPLQSGQAFGYVLTVTNHGTRAATNLIVTDSVPTSLTVTGIDLPAGWSNKNAPAFVGAGNTVALNGPSLDVGASAVVTLHVTVNSVTASGLPNLGLTPMIPGSVLVNQACVQADIDLNPTNNCGSVTVQTKAAPLIPVLPATGGSPMLPLIILGFLVILGGVTALGVSRRRRGEAKLRL